MLYGIRSRYEIPNGNVDCALDRIQTVVVYDLLFHLNYQWPITYEFNALPGEIVHGIFSTFSLSQQLIHEIKS